MTRKRVHCAIYTRKSSDEGLDQSFNSLDAQREACAAYIKSQAGEGWRALSARYDDGGVSGGTMDRPALRQLLEEVARGGIEIIVVYKIDRLTRSLPDFARMVEIFDRHGVSFVSVTQAFNTTSSMGRLTLNVLLSFAQFEREVTGERIRDKIAASKARGMWMGGRVPLGYDPPTDGSRRLSVNAEEAAQVRRIFAAYLELGSVHKLERWLARRGIHSKARADKDGRVAAGGQRLRRGALAHLLRNPVYIGLIRHGETRHEGLHAAIVGRDLFEAVQQKLGRAGARRRSGGPSVTSAAPLTGRIFDATGQRMSPTFAVGARGTRYRYFVSSDLQQGKCAPQDDILRRVPADIPN
ncbi:MAG: recombinase family protein [Pseudomonadota bacterium]